MTKNSPVSEKRFMGHTRRVVEVGSSVASLVLGMAGRRYLGVGNDLDHAAAKATAVLGGLKGPFMKVFQILATIPDVMPKEYSDALRQLQSNAPPMGWSFVQRRMCGELGSGWAQKLPEFSHKAIHAASLGQVHRAKLPDGCDVACKLQYPDMRSVVDADLKQLKVILNLYMRTNPAISPENIYAELVDRLHEELDYCRELKHLMLYREMLQDESCVTVPEPIAELSTDRLLVMQWLSGSSLMDVGDAPPEQRNALARAMFRTWYVPFYRYGIIHGDSHPGNYSAREDHGVNLLDFGCVRVFSPQFVLGVMELYYAIRDQDQDRAAHAYELWGFDHLSREVLEILNVWANFLYAPFLEDRVQRIQQSDSGQYGAGIAGGVYKRLKERGGVTPPREFLLMDRAAIGLGAVFLRMRAEINWYQEFHRLISGFDHETMAQNQADILKRHGLDGS
ncbi:MAG: AarF/ABC1/UbiB kinase family protein [Alphaproteobacteria bacterium]|nr:AarF/ABC1/UbiB kinase family protein [Alphaproteobacteria bacterium]